MRNYKSPKLLNSLPSYLLFRLAVLSMTLVAPLVLADNHGVNPENDSDVVTLDEYVSFGTVLYADQVNALRTPTPVIDVPQSLSIVTADQIALQGFTSIGDIINYTPGVNTSQGEGHRDAVVFRGVRSTADFFIDGVRDDVQYYRPLYNLEQVEILRGPNALLFGRGGTGGILNRVTKKGVIGADFGGYQASIDSFGELGVQIDTNHSIDEKSAIRVNGIYENLDNHRDFYDGKRIGINPTARFELSPSTTLDLSYEYLDHQRFIDRGIPTGSNGRPVKALKEIVFGDSILNTTELEAHLLRATLEKDFSDNLKGNFNVFTGDYDKMYQNFYASKYYQDTTPNEVTLDGYVDTTQRQNTVLSGSLIGEINTNGVIHTLIVGAEVIDTSSNQDRYNTHFNTTSSDKETFTINRPLDLKGGIGVNSSGEATANSFTASMADDTRVNIDVFSAFIQDEIQVNEKFDVILGLRADKFDIEVYNAKSPETRKKKDEEFSPRLGLVLKPQENVSFYGSYSKSFLPRSGEQFANINGTKNQLDPNTFSNLEAGVKVNFSQGLSFTGSIFEVEQSSPQVADNDPSTLDVIDSQITGFELQLQGQVNEQWFITAGYSNLDGEQVKRSGPTGLRPRELPENMISVWNTFRVSDAFGVGLGITNQDESFINNGNTATLPSYTRVDAALYFDVSEDLRVQVNVENLTDELYFPNSHSTHQATVGAPFNARVALIGRF